MCEYCSKNEITVEKLNSDEAFPCEWTLLSLTSDFDPESSLS